MKLTHIDSRGRASMVDIGRKKKVRRAAVAEGTVRVSRRTVELIRESGLPKGNPFEVARIAGIQAAKKTSDLIPLCHDLSLDHVDVEVRVSEEGFQIESRVSCRWATGVEMEALTAVTVAALTLYDMCKAADKNITIEGIRLVEKRKDG